MSTPFSTRPRRPGGPTPQMSEFELINRLQQIICAPPGADSFRCIVGIGDDGAVLDVPAGRHLVVCTDTLVEGVHFPLSTEPAAVGHKALAVNLSDLAAMGAQPAWFFMALTLPSENPGWLDSFARGMARLAAEAAIELAGGDVSSGPLSVTVTALGWVDKGKALLRSGATEGDLVVISGRPGAAAHALQDLQSGLEPGASDRECLDFPVPRLQLGLALHGLATACIDISDGLAADLNHIVEQSGVGAKVRLDRLPVPASLEPVDEEQRWPLQVSGGDDYELCFTVPASSKAALAEVAAACGVELTVIGKVTPGPGVDFEAADGRIYEPLRDGYRHFDDEEKVST